MYTACKDVGIKKFEFVEKTQFLFTINKQKYYFVFEVGGMKDSKDIPFIIVFYRSQYHHYLQYSPVYSAVEGVYNTYIILCTPILLLLSFSINYNNKQ